MMETAYALLTLEPGTKKDFIRKAREIEGVKEARLVIGLFDAVVKIEAENIGGLERTYFNKIDKIHGTINSRLHIVACPRTRK